MRPAIIDFEASSLKPPSFPIEVAVVDAGGAEFQRLIRPSQTWINEYRWDPESEKIHGIPKSILLEDGCDLVNVAKDLNDFVGDGTVYCDGGVYDINWANELYAAAGIDRRFQIASIFKLIQDSGVDKRISYYDVVEYVHDKHGLNRHRALDDVLAIQEATSMIIGGRIPKELEERWKRHYFLK